MTKYRKIFSCKNKKLAENKNFTLWQFSTTTTAWLTGTGFLCKKLTPGRHSGKKIKEHARAGLFIKVTSFIVTGSGTNQFSLFDCPLSKWRHILAPLRGKLKKEEREKKYLKPDKCSTLLPAKLPEEFFHLTGAMRVSESSQWIDQSAAAAATAAVNGHQEKLARKRALGESAAEKTHRKTRERQQQQLFFSLMPARLCQMIAFKGPSLMMHSH